MFVEMGERLRQRNARERDVRAAWGWTRSEQLARDGLRQVRRNPAFSGIAIATLAAVRP
jgi:hypothetical protein